MLEFPLWYGPFQLVTLLAVGLLWRRPVPCAGCQGLEIWGKRPLSHVLKRLVAVSIAFMAHASGDYWRGPGVSRQDPLALRQGTLDVRLLVVCQRGGFCT